MIIKYSDTNENRIYRQHRKDGEWKTAELDELIEVYEREKTGKWLDIKPALFHLSYATCSLCGKRSAIEEANYCPNCGARMVD